MATAMVLLVGAAVSLRAFERLSEVGLGFETKGVVAAKLWLPAGNSRSGIAAVDALLSRVVESNLAEVSGIVDSLPLADDQKFLYVRNRSGAAMCGYFVVGGDYFRSMEIPLVQGRAFSPHDRDAVIVSAALAKRLWGNRTPVGDSLVIDGESNARQVIGVIGDVRAGRPDEDRVPPQFYLPYRHPYRGTLPNTSTITLVVKSTSHSPGTQQRLREKLERVGARVVWVRTVDDVLAQILAPAKLRAMVAGFYAFFGLLLALGGVYGLMRFVVTARTHEMGVRMALGANSTAIGALLIGYSVRICSMGIGLGALCAVPLLHLARSLLYGVSAADPVIYSVAALCLLLGGVLAPLGSVLHVTRTSPRQVLLQ